MNKHTVGMLWNLKRLGIDTSDALALRRIAMTLHRWSERECNGEIERDDDTGKTYAVYAYYGAPGTVTRPRVRCPDLEQGAMRRLEKIMARYPGLAAYVQGDPRGAALYIYWADALKAGRFAGHKIDSCYSSIGTAVHS